MQKIEVKKPIIAPKGWKKRQEGLSGVEIRVKYRSNTGQIRLYKACQRIEYGSKG